MIVVNKYGHVWGDIIFSKVLVFVVIANNMSNIAIIFEYIVNICVPFLQSQTFYSTLFIPIKIQLILLYNV